MNSALGNSDLDCVERLLDVNLKKYPKVCHFFEQVFYFLLVFNLNSIEIQLKSDKQICI